MILGKYDFDLDRALKAQQGTPLEFGSEFRDTKTLAPLLSRHPLWPKLESILSKGSSYPLEPLDEELRRKDLELALKYGNHKGALKNSSLLFELNEKDVIHGYGLVFPLRFIDKIPGAIMSPMNIAAQNTINELGQIVGKNRLTHDQSFCFKDGSGTSVNTRVIKTELLPCMFGACVRRQVNWYVAARRKFPGVRLPMTKVDWKSAFKRMHLDAKSACQTCTQIPEHEVAIIALRLTFGGSPNPSEWGAVSETCCDLVNALLHDPDWDPLELEAPYQDLIPPYEPLPDDIPFAAAKKQFVDIPVNDKGKNEVFIDDLMGATVDLPGTNNVQRLERALLLAIHVLARPLQTDEPIPRETMAALNKLISEAGLTERKVNLGWLFDTRRLLISLPDNKKIAWIREIDEMLGLGKASATRLERNIGRYINVAQIIPAIYHFLNRLRSLEKRAKKQRGAIKLNQECIDDLKFLRRVIELANRGIDMNLIAYLLPERVYRSDSCPYGLGGYSDMGIAWRWYIPEDLLFRATNNLLEHIATIIGPWLDMIQGRLRKGDCKLSIADSTTSCGWRKKTNFETDPDLLLAEEGTASDPIEGIVRMEVCRFDALLLLENEICDFSQWLEGAKNNVSDSLSRDFDIDNEQLTLLLQQKFPEQVPEHFTIVPLPNEIVSWLTSTLQKLPVKEQLREKRMTTNIALGADGPSTSSPSESTMTSSSTTSSSPNEPFSLERLPWLCGRGDFRDQLMIPWLREQSQIPSHLWHRPSGRMEDATHPSMMTGNLASFYQGSTEPSETQTNL